MQNGSKVLDGYIKKKTEQLRPVSDKEFRYASLLYHSAFDEELVDRGYNKQDLDYIIDLAQKKLYIDEMNEDNGDWDKNPLH